MWCFAPRAQSEARVEKHGGFSPPPGRLPLFEEARGSRGARNPWAGRRSPPSLDSRATPRPRGAEGDRTARGWRITPTRNPTSSRRARGPQVPPGLRLVRAASLESSGNPLSISPPRQPSSAASAARLASYRSALDCRSAADVHGLKPIAAIVRAIVDSTAGCSWTMSSPNVTRFCAVG